MHTTLSCECGHMEITIKYSQTQITKVMRSRMPYNGHQYLSYSQINFIKLHTLHQVMNVVTEKLLYNIHTSKALTNYQSNEEPHALWCQYNYTNINNYICQQFSIKYCIVKQGDLLNKYFLR